MSADAQLRAFIDRILRCREVEDDAKADTKAVYAELAAAGFEKAIAGQVVAYLRKREKDGDKLAEQSAMFDLYLDAYERSSHVHTRARGTENSPSSVAPTPATDGQAGVVQSPLSAPAANSNPQPTSSPEADGAGDVPPPASPADPIPDFVPAFLVPAEARQRVKLRPNCLRPDTCAGQGARHCHSCEKAAAQSEAA